MNYNSNKIKINQILQEENKKYNKHWISIFGHKKIKIMIKLINN